MIQRALIRLSGAVQGVGFRPFLFNLAKDIGLKGFVTNDAQGISLDVEGKADHIRRFLDRIAENKPPLAHIQRQDVHYLEELVHYESFRIRPSELAGRKEVQIIPDLSTCDACFSELQDPCDRRFLYPFINCTNCGPRFTIITSVPYDRSNTTMACFEMCPSCQQEYENPQHRRFHAQPNACPDCGPSLSLRDPHGRLLSIREDALKMAMSSLQDGSILAIKGIGGFHLACDARRGDSLEILRNRKKRLEKPFAVMFRDMVQLKEYADLNETQEALVLSSERPIVLVSRKDGTDLSSLVAPHLKTVGAFLPYSPLHFILMQGLGFPLVMTSANLSDEPIIKDNDEAYERLHYFCDAILDHDREIENHCDDSVVKLIESAPLIVRSSRGYAPLSLELPFHLDKKVLAVGAHQKSVVALAFENKAVATQHIGDLETLEACERFGEVIESFQNFYDFEPELIVHDLHPGYYTTKWAKAQGTTTLAVPHHQAHALSLMADNQLGPADEILALTWDGTGLGWDGSLWGGDCLISRYEGCKRCFHFDYFKLIGGQRAIKEPRRVALSLLFHLFGREALAMDLPVVTSFSRTEREGLFTAWQNSINAPDCSSVGRLFDAVASLLDIKQILSYEGQSGMIMEDLYDPHIVGHYPYHIDGGRILWQPVFQRLLQNRRDTVEAVSKFINTLAVIAVRLGRDTDLPIGLTGGVFQNRALVAKILSLAESARIKVLLHKRVPPNDGGLFLGQIAAAIGS